jgi:hypothetical protein
MGLVKLPWPASSLQPARAVEAKAKAMRADFPNILIYGAVIERRIGGLNENGK